MNIIKSKGETNNDLENYIIKLTAIFYSKRPLFSNTLAKLIKKNHVKNYVISSSDIHRFIKSNSAEIKATALNQFKTTGVKSGIFTDSDKDGVYLNPVFFTSNGKLSKSQLSFEIHYTNDSKQSFNDNTQHVSSVLNNGSSNAYINDLIALLKTNNAAKDNNISKIIMMFDQDNKIKMKQGSGDFGKRCIEIGLKNNRSLRDKINLFVDHSIFTKKDGILKLNTCFIESKEWFSNFKYQNHRILVSFKNGMIHITT